MKLIIDIPEEIYTDICDNGYIFDEDSVDIAKAIKNGTSVSTEGDLISRSALKKAIEGIVVGGEERLKDYYENGSKADENAWIGGIYDAWELCVIAPTVEPEITNDDLQAAMTESYHLGYELAETKFKRPPGEWIICNQDNEGIHKIECPFCKYVCGSDFGDQITMTFQKLPNYCENCGADMRKEKEE
ncbi:MAG: hypothetical protein J6S67_11735 [Methanobrevibacter sp.]|nr:hypothetical protein [Methanobrevibacter sp.]